eukprot:GHRR01034974.1.p1 GENE.GHRR01034974.1~~GHRR01034974.1.p1  ORF type:complete len:129 (-),score=31.45 GHRR01034974.1:221-607(-)
MLTLDTILLLEHGMIPASTMQPTSGEGSSTLSIQCTWLLLCCQVSKFLADQTMDAIGEMFSSARAIMGWLADCARLVAAENAPVKWHSPLGLPITQPYYKMQMRVVQTATQSFQVGSAAFMLSDGWDH